MRKYIGLALIMGVLVAGSQLVVIGTTNLYQYSKQEAINKLLGAKPHEYTMQQGLNLLLTKPACRDSLVTLFTWNFSDGFDEWVDDGWIDSMVVYGQVATHNVFGYASLHNDAYLTGDELRAMEALGHEIVPHGYNPGGSLYDDDNPNIWYTADGTISDLRRGWINQADTDRDIERCVAAWDSLGLTPPRGFCYSTNSNYLEYARALQRNGFEWARTNRSTLGGFGFNYMPDVRRAFSHGTIDSKWYLAAYPGLLLPSFYLPKQMSDNGTNLALFKDQVLNAIVAKGSWIIFGGHTPSYWLAQEGADFSEAMAWIDSLRSEGLLRVVTMSEGYDLMYNTPICETASFIYPNFEDHNNDDVIDGMMATWDHIDFGFGAKLWAADSLGTRDSVYVDSTRVDHGVMGEGYAVLAWGDASNYVNWRNESAPNNDIRWYTHYDMTYRLPNVWRGKNIICEFWAQVDQSVAYVPGDGDSVGVVFRASYDAKKYCIGSSGEVHYAPYPGRSVPNNFGNNPYSSMQYTPWQSHYEDGPAPSNYQVFTASDTVGGTWRHNVAYWTPPEEADYVYISISKSNGLENAVRISNISIRAADRYPNKW